MRTLRLAGANYTAPDYPTYQKTLGTLSLGYPIEVFVTRGEETCVATKKPALRLLQVVGRGRGCSRNSCGMTAPSGGRGSGTDRGVTRIVGEERIGEGG